jgi:hypothetical protein
MSGRNLLLALMLIGFTATGCYMSVPMQACGRKHHFDLYDSSVTAGHVNYYVFRCQRMNCNDTDTFPKFNATVGMRPAQMK